jgi:hypothetical protein
MLLSVATRFGYGEHIWNIPPQNLETVLKIIYAYGSIWVAANAIIKLAILLFYRRIFCPVSKPSPRFGRLIDASLILVAVWGIAFSFWAAFVCAPLRAYWSPTFIKGQKCRSLVTKKSHSVLDLALDVYLLILPQYKIWNMRMEMHKKIAVAAVMSFALLAVIASAIRLTFVFSTFSSFDITWERMQLFYWSGAELVLGIGCTCAPAIRAFFTTKNGPALRGRLHTLQDVTDHSNKSAVTETTLESREV